MMHDRWMRIEILHIDECPNWLEAGRRLEDALVATGHPDVSVNFRLLRSSQEAEAVHFAGSPTITLDGDDLFSSAARISDLACRVYVTPTGLAGLPTTEQLVEAITRLAS